MLRYQVEMQAVQQYQGTQGSSSAVSESKLLRSLASQCIKVEVEGQSVSSVLCLSSVPRQGYQSTLLITLLKDEDLGSRSQQTGSPTAISVPAFDKR